VSNKEKSDARAAEIPESQQHWGDGETFMTRAQKLKTGGLMGKEPCRFLQ
jgi:hypothetical protein